MIWREAYSGYGERIKNEAASAPNKVWYTSRHQDADTGLVYMGARYYDPALGRFLSVDSVGFNEQNVHSFNRYAYGNNNPYRFKDPDGRLAIPAVVTGLFLVAGGVYVANCESCVQSAGRALRTVGGAIRGLGNWAFNESAEGDAGAKGADTPKGQTDTAVDGLTGGLNNETDSKGRPTKGQYVKPGGHAQQDLDSLPGTTGATGQKTLPDGSVAGLHTSTTTGLDTLHIHRPSGSRDVKIRYPE